MKRSIEVRSCVPVKLRVKVKSTRSPTSYFCDFKLLKDASSFVMVSFRWAMSILPFTVNSPLLAANVLKPCGKTMMPYKYSQQYTTLSFAKFVSLFTYFYSIIKRKLTSVNFMYICFDLFVLFCLAFFDWVFLFPFSSFFSLFVCVL